MGEGLVKIQIPIQQVWVGFKLCIYHTLTSDARMLGAVE